MYINAHRRETGTQQATSMLPTSITFPASLHGSGWNTFPAQSHPSFRSSLRQCLIPNPPGSGGSWTFRITRGNSAQYRLLGWTPTRHSRESAVWPRSPHPGDTHMCSVGLPPEKQALTGLLLRTSQQCVPIFLVALPNLIDVLASSAPSRDAARCGLQHLPQRASRCPVGWDQAWLGKERASSEKEAWVSSVQRPIKCPDGRKPFSKRQSLSSKPKSFVFLVAPTFVCTLSSVKEGLVPASPTFPFWNSVGCCKDGLERFYFVIFFFKAS